MFYAALGNLLLPAPSTLRARLLKRQYVQAWECRMGGFFLYVLPSRNRAPPSWKTRVSGLCKYSTREEVAGSSNKDEHVGKRKVGKGERKKERDRH